MTEQYRFCLPNLNQIDAYVVFTMDQKKNQKITQFGGGPHGKK